MLILGIACLIIVLGIICIKKGKKKYNDGLEIFGWSISIIISFCVISALIIEYPTKTRIEYDIAQYTELRREVHQLSNLGGNTCDLNILARKDLFKEVRKMNNYIDKNRIKSKSPWVSMFYSKEIGNLEKINYK